MESTYQQFSDSLKDDNISLRAFATLAHHAPSVHNTQPWIFKIKDQQLHILPHNARPLPHSDPALRQTWISLGAAAQNIIAIAEASSTPYTVKISADGIVFSFKKLPLASSVKPIIHTILNRHNNRNYFSMQPLPTNVVTQLNESCSHSNESVTIFVRDRQQIETLAEMIGNATRLALSSKNMRHELSHHINSPHKPVRTGIPARSISISSTGWLEKHTTRWSRFVQSKANKEYERFRHSALLALTFTPGDTTQDWVAAGREYERLCLQITELSLSHSTNAALVEAPDYYKEVSELLGTPLRLQTLVRIGHGKPTKTRSRRLPLKEVLHTVDDSR